LIHLRHKNVLSIQDVFIDNTLDIYFVTELFDMDLDKLLSTKKIEAEYVEYFIFQLMVYLFDVMH
jgi:p38 MAP kinase